MSPWLFLGWVVAVAVSLFVITFAIAAVIVVVRQAIGRPVENRRIKKSVNAH
jgi:hypothetical protein